MVIDNEKTLVVVPSKSKTMCDLYVRKDEAAALLKLIQE